MKWKCQFCLFSTKGQGRILQHYKERHGHYRSIEGLIYIHKDCLKTFQTQPELKSPLEEHLQQHLNFNSRDHKTFASGQKTIWKTEDKAKVQDCVQYIFLYVLTTTHQQ